MHSMNVTLTINTNDRDDLIEAADLLQNLLAVLPAPAEPLTTVIAKVANPAKFGDNRLGYLKLVAEAGDAGVEIDDLKANHFNGDHGRYGGTHSSVERAWKGSGGLAHAPELIAETPDRRHVMFPDARPLILELLA